MRALAIGAIAALLAGCPQNIHFGSSNPTWRGTRKVLSVTAIVLGIGGILVAAASSTEDRNPDDGVKPFTAGERIAFGTIGLGLCVGGYFLWPEDPPPPPPPSPPAPP